MDVQSWGSVVCVWGSAQRGWRCEAHSVTGVRQTCNTTEGKISLVYTHVLKAVWNYRTIKNVFNLQNGTSD